MTQPEYNQFKANVEDFFKEQGITNLSSIDHEEFFSWRPCECCGTPLGGNRENANGYNPTTKEVLEFTVCTDCLYYVEYGQLDDQTMLDGDLS